MHRGQTYQESNLTILSTPFYETRQARYFLKHAKHAIFLSTPSTSFHGARQARKERQAHVKHAKHASTQARHLADSIASAEGKMFE